MKFITFTALAVVILLVVVVLIITKTTPSPTPFMCSKKYTIAIIGDSMVDTMGEEMEYLQVALTKKYPQCSFSLYNYGVGAQTIYQGFDRFALPFKNKTRDFPAIPELKPDILIVASFAYNPRYPFNRDEHWLKLIDLVKAAQKVTKNVYILAEIAPLGDDFGKGAENLASWDDKGRLEHSQDVIAQLDNVAKVGKTLNIPVIDAYSKSQIPGTKFSKPVYVNPSDHIHPSDNGHILIADLIAATLMLK